VGKVERGRFYQPVGERSGSDQTFSVGNPVDLAGNIRAIVQQERTNRTEHFNPAWWLRGKIDVIASEAVWQDQPEEKQQFFDDLRIVWQLVAYEKIADQHSSSVYTDIRTHTMGRRRITLSPLAVTLLDAMAQALDIPQKPGQATFDVSLFSAQVAEEKIKHNALSLAPTVEEVKRAIATSVDDEK